MRSWTSFGSEAKRANVDGGVVVVIGNGLVVRATMAVVTEERWVVGEDIMVVLSAQLYLYFVV